MNISYNWLKDLIDLDLTAGETAAALTRVGLAVEGIHPHGDDFVLDIDLTSNRPDCLSHLGVARELSAITGIPLLQGVIDPAAPEDDPLASVPFPSVPATEVVRIENPELCNRFTARIIRGVKIGPSPHWLVDRLEAIGERSINNVADITNYVMHELGQPMHAFDLDKLAENRIIVRTARQGETITTLDEVNRELDETMLAICDAERPVAVAGVMGGLESGITGSTTNVLLEVAHFKRESIRKTSRTLGLATEASYRFERGVDIENLRRASKRAAELICELTGGEAGEFVDVYPTEFSPNEIRTDDISLAVKRLSGIEVETGECVRILNSLGIREQGTPQVFSSPSWRHDIAIEEDLVEEITRHIGYDVIGSELPPAFGAGDYQVTEARKRGIRQTLVGMGFAEAISYSFIDTKFDDWFDFVPGLINEKSPGGFVSLRDSVIEGAIRMRPTLLAGLLDAVRLNLNHQRPDIQLFELGKAFAGETEATVLPDERELIAFVMTGGELLENHAVPARQLDFYDLKGSIEACIDAAGLTDAQFVAGDAAHLQQGQSAFISVNSRIVGTAGKLCDPIASRYKFKQPVYVAEIDLTTILQQGRTPVTYRQLPRFPSIVRDVSFLTDRSLEFGEIKQSVVDQSVSLCRKVSFLDVYEGKGMEPNKRSITLRLEYRSDDRTLTDDEVDMAHSTILSRLERDLGVKPRV